jgi:hypothetical protein
MAPTYTEYWQAAEGDSVEVHRDPDETFRWQLFDPDHKLKLEAGNFPSAKAAEAAARKAHGKLPTYSFGEEV